MEGALIQYTGQKTVSRTTPVNQVQCQFGKSIPVSISTQDDKEMYLTVIVHIWKRFEFNSSQYLNAKFRFNNYVHTKKTKSHI